MGKTGKSAAAGYFKVWQILRQREALGTTEARNPFWVRRGDSGWCSLFLLME